MNKSITVVKREHAGWVDFTKARKTIPAFTLPPTFERYQYLYTKGKITISLIQFAESLYGEYRWEIYEMGGKTQVLEDVERFKSKKDAERRIRELLVDE